MSTPAPPPGPGPGQDAAPDEDTGSGALAGAAAALRSHTDAGWQRARPGLLTTAMAAFRPSDPARGRHARGTFWVSSDVVVQLLGSVVEAVPGARAERITCVTGDLDLLERVEAQIAVAYGADLLAVAGEVRRSVEAELRAALGEPVDDAGAALPATQVHVRVVDITWSGAADTSRDTTRKTNGDTSGS